MDQEVAKTLSELELKLQALERELTSIGHRDTSSGVTNDSAPAVGETQAEPTPASASPLDAPGKLIDEVVEQEYNTQREAEQSAHEENVAVGDGFGGPAVFGGEEIPAQAGATIERDWTVEVRETAYGEIPTPPATAPHPDPPPYIPVAPHTMAQSPPPGLSQDSSPPLPPPSPSHFSHQPPPPPSPAEPQPIDLADLVRFRDKLERTMDELVEEYTQLLSSKTTSHPRRDA